MPSSPLFPGTEAAARPLATHYARTTYSNTIRANGTAVYRDGSPAYVLLAVFRDVVFFEVFRDVDFFAVFRDPDAFGGTLPPARLASDNPMAIACFRLVTFLPNRPLFSAPSFRSCMALSTFSDAFLPYLATSVLLPQTVRPVYEPPPAPSSPPSSLPRAGHGLFIRRASRSPA